MISKEKRLQNKAYYYAKAILNIAEANNTVDKVEEEFEQLKNEIVSNIALKEYLQDTSIKKTEKIKSVLEILRKDVSEEIKAFTIVLVLLDAVDIIEKIFSYFVELVNKLKKQVFVEVISAVNLDRSMIEKIKKRVDSKIGLNSRISNTIDKSIIGGIIIKIGDNLIDLSIKNKIEDLKTELKSIELRGEEFGSNNKVRQNS